MFSSKKLIKKNYILNENENNLPVHTYIASVDNTISRSISLQKENKSKNHYHILVYLWTNAKPLEQEKIIEQAKPFFSQIIFLEIPRGNQKTNIWSIKKLYNIYKKFLEEEKVQYLTAFSFERHYALLYTIAEKMGIYTTLSEEGTASYRYLIKDESYLIPQETLKEHILIIYKRYWKNGFLDKIIRYIIKDIKGLFKMYEYIFTLDNIHYLFLKNHPTYQSFCKPYKNFSELHLDYPNLLENYFQADKVTYSTIPTETEYDGFIKNIIQSENYNKNTIFYASQLVWGLDNMQTYYFLIPMFKDFHKKYGQKIIVKPHPKEERDLIEHLIAPYSDSISLMPECPYPMERIIYFTKPRSVISIGSSTLVYGKLASENTEFIAIAEFLYNKIQKTPSITNRTRKFFEEIIPMMKLFPHINHF